MSDKRLVLGYALAALFSCAPVFAAAAEGPIDFDQGVSLPALPPLAVQGRQAMAAAQPAVAAATAPEFVERTRTARVWPEIVFVRGADYAEFAYTMSQNRDQVRKMMLQEFGDLLIPLVSTNSDLNALAKTIIGAILTFDQMHAKHKDEAVQGLQTSFEHNLRAELDKLFSGNRLRDGQRRIEFVSPASAAYKQVKSGASGDQSAVVVLEGVDYLMHGSYTLLGGSNIQVTLTLEKLVGGNSRSFSTAGSINGVIPELARQLFDFFQANEYGDWVDPQPTLTWLPSPPGQPEATATVGKMYCRSQGARLPYTRELILASQGGQYRQGGIAPLADNAVYLVADKQRYDEQYYFFTGSSGDATGGPVRSSAGYGVIHARYWCVRGQSSEEVNFYEGLYRELRRASDPQVKQAIECLLVGLEDFGAFKWNCRDAMSTEQAQDLLARKGYSIRLP